MVIQKHQDRLFDNRLKRIENRLRRIEIILMKSLKSDKKLRKEIKILEKEEKIIENEQKTLETEENKIITEMKHLEQEERWNLEVRYHCKAKVMGNQNEINCEKNKKACDMALCPLWKN